MSDMIERVARDPNPSTLIDAVVLAVALGK